MSSTESVTRWISRIKEGDRGGVEKLLDRYLRRLVQLARKKLQTLPRLAGYEEDVALSALKSVCLGAERGRFPQLFDRDDLWRLLVVITVRKAIDLMRRNRPEEEAAEPYVEELLSSDPSPALAAEMAEECQRLFDRLGDAELQSIAHWKVQGYTTAEIAGKLDCTLRTVERKLRIIRGLWQQEGPP
jgi:DNA-directed RNA polymerase specialized sigma24 family protein